MYSTSDSAIPLNPGKLKLKEYNFPLIRTVSKIGVNNDIFLINVVEAKLIIVPACL